MLQRRYADENLKWIGVNSWDMVIRALNGCSESTAKIERIRKFFRMCLLLC